MQWPPDYLAEFNRRQSLYAELTRNDKLREEVMPHYEQNPVLWINDFCITYDPRKKDPEPKKMPFILFPRQAELVDCILQCIDEGEGLLVEKSRDMGASWLCCAIVVHQWLFKPGVAFGFGSRKQDYVDKIGDAKSIFEKIRQILRALPFFMLPADFNIDRHAPFMKIINPQNAAQITGEAGDNIGRGGRTTAYFKDESAHYEHAEKIEAALGDNTDCQIDISSVNGPGNVFHTRRKAGDIWYPGKKMARNKTRIFILDWRDHPGKDEEWYEDRREKAEREGLMSEFSQEVDRDYLSSRDRIIIDAKWVKASINAHKKLAAWGDWTGAKRAALDVADEGRDKNAYAFVDGVILKHCEDWGRGDTSKTAKRAVNLTKLHGVTELFYDCIGVGAGIKGETNRMEEEKTLPKTLSVLPWNAAASGKALVHPDKNLIPGDMNTPKNKDYFASLSAQAYYMLARRFYKTYKAVTVGRRYPVEELISIDGDLEQLQEIIDELSQAQQTETGTGKMKVEKAPEGTKSPNLADAIKMAFWPVHRGVNYEKLLTL